MCEFCKNNSYDPAKKNDLVFVLIALIAFGVGLFAGINLANSSNRKHCKACHSKDEDFDSVAYVRSMHLDNDNYDED